MDRRKLYKAERIEVDFTPDGEEKDPELQLGIIVMKSAISPNLRRALGEMAQVALQGKDDLEAASEADEPDLAGMMSKLEEIYNRQENLAQEVALCIDDWELTDNGVKVPFSVERFLSEGDAFIQTVCLGLVRSIAPNLTTEP